MKNIKFSYLYRDAGNYKRFGEVVFSNKQNINLNTIENNIRLNLIEQVWFDPLKVNVPPVFFEMKNDDDHDWHEFESVELTNEEITDDRNIDEFILQLT